MTLRDMLILHEGMRLKPYKDTRGKLTIGVGRNLDDNGISEEEALLMLDNDIEKHNAALLKAFPWTEHLDVNRRMVLQNMAFNMGIPTLSQFKTTLSLIRQARYEEAGDEMLKSAWAGQVGIRAVQLSKIMKTGENNA